MPRNKPSPNGGFFHSLRRQIEHTLYKTIQANRRDKLEALEPKFEELKKKNMDDFTMEDRHHANDYAVLNQRYHTLRRRKFMQDASEHINKKGQPLPTQWEALEAELKNDVRQREAMRHPGGDRARLWSNEAKFRVADEYSRETQRRTLAEQSLDTSKVGTAAPRNFYLEPGMPPSYKARAALALKNEGRLGEKDMEARMRTLMDRAAVEVPLATALERQATQAAPIISVKVPYFTIHSRFSSVSRRGYCTQTPRDTNSSKTTPETAPPPAVEDDQTDSIISRFRAWFAKNGPLGVVLYLGYSMIDLGAIYFLLSTGVDMAPVINFFGFDKGAGAATFAIAYAMHKSLAPLRAGLVLWTIPKVKPYWDAVISKVETYAIKNDDRIQKFTDRFDGKPKIK